MIVDEFSRVAQYEGVLPRVAQYIAFAKKASQLATGRYELENGDFALIHEGMTNPIEEGLFETHEKFADLQYVLIGQECVEWQVPDKLEIVRPYEAEADIAQYKGKGSVVAIPAGTFYYVLPQDAHKPGIHVDQATPCRKIVFKIKL